jgi:Mrp family chromosome partitioning ATPase/capsular polysaccharide biosynthesis protein
MIHPKPRLATTPGETTVPVPAARPRAAKVEPANPAALVLGYLRLHALLILFCGTFLGGALAYAAWSLLPVKYESYALLQVASSPSSIAMGTDPNRSRTDFTTYLKTTAQLIKSDFVLNSALSDANYQISKLPTLAEQKNPIKFLEDKIVVSYAEGSEVITIRFEGDNPQDVGRIVEAVKEAYYREVVEKERNTKKRFRIEVEQAKTQLQSVMNTRTAINDRKAQPLPTGPSSGPLLQAGGVPVPEIPGLPAQNPGGPAVVPAAAQAAAVATAALQFADNELFKKARAGTLMGRITQYEIELQQFPVLIDEKKADVERLKKELDATGKVPPSPEAFAAADKDPEILAKNDAAARKRRDYDYIRSVVRDPNSDKLVRQKRELDDAEAEAASARVALATRLEGQRDSAKGNRLAVALDAAVVEYRRMLERERVAKSIFEDAKKEFAALPPDLKRADDKLPPLVDPEKTDLLTHDGMYRRITEQLIGLDFELKSPPRVSKLQDASAPSAKDPKKQTIAAAVAGLMGFGLVGLGAVGYESRVRKVSSLGELKTVGTTPVVGVVPWQPTAATANDPLKKADVTEAIDKLRAVVAQTWLTRGVRTIAVTSPHGDEGKAFTAFGLANGLAQAGYRTLLVDLDLRNPSLHHFAGLPNSTGACDVLRAECDARAGQMVLPSGLTLLPAGTWTDELRRTAVGNRLDGMLREFREDFDCVVLHGHGLLSVSESIETVRRADAVLLCTLYRETRMPLLKRALDRLAALDVPTTGIVYVGATRHEALC